MPESGLGKKSKNAAFAISYDGENAEEYEVEDIVNFRKVFRGSKPSYEYFIKWKNYPSEQNTWEHESNLNPSCQQLTARLVAKTRRDEAISHNVFPQESQIFNINDKVIERNSLNSENIVEILTISDGKAVVKLENDQSEIFLAKIPTSVVKSRAKQQYLEFLQCHLKFT